VKAEPAAGAIARVGAVCFHFHASRLVG
jgi:hypothetical protein